MLSSKDILPDIYKETLVRVWGLSDYGEPVCRENAVQANSLAGKKAHMFNQKLLQRLIDYETYERALVILNNPESSEEEVTEANNVVTSVSEDALNLYKIRARSEEDEETIRSQIQTRSENDLAQAEIEANSSTIVLYVPQSITRRQLILRMWQMGMITAEEAISAGFGEIPSNILSVLESLTEEESISVKVTWSSMNEVYRNDTILIAIAYGLSMTDEDMDNFFSEASKI